MGDVFYLDICILIADSCCCKQKPIQHCKEIMLQINKIIIIIKKNWGQKTVVQGSNLSHSLFL